VLTLVFACWLQVLLVFVQDVALKESVVVCAALLFLSLGLHGLAYRSGQCKVCKCRPVYSASTHCAAL
jgi:hypothetical protein